MFSSLQNSHFLLIFFFNSVNNCAVPWDTATPWVIYKRALIDRTASQIERVKKETGYKTFFFFSFSQHFSVLYLNLHVPPHFWSWISIRHRCVSWSFYTSSVHQADCIIRTWNNDSLLGTVFSFLSFSSLHNNRTLDNYEPRFLPFSHSTFFPIDRRFSDTSAAFASNSV